MIGSKEEYALVTGASSGIGYELAKLFAKDGKNIVVVARSQDRLERLKTEIENKSGTKVIVLLKDLSNPNAPQEIFSELEKKVINLDVLVNNAGFGLYGLFCQTELQEELKMVQVHVASLIHLTNLFLKQMIENKSGWILNVASGAGFAPFPLWSIYSASKSFVLSFSEALANELQGTGISVTCLCPGPTDTRIWEKGNMQNCKLAKGKKLRASTVAEAGYRALKRGKVIVVPSLKYGLAMQAYRILPRNVATSVNRSQL
jgi:short-subunit dehydrogenase